MGSYVPSNQEERGQLLAALGIASMDALFDVIPPEMRLAGLDLPEGLSELEVSRLMRGVAAKNTVFASVFRGAGAYRHYIPAIVRAVATKEQFVTAYTPYQAEISQGILQSIFEYQTMICRLTGMDAANASVYDGATAAAEAVNMCREKKRNRALISATVHPMVRETVQTYCFGNGIELVTVPAKDGRTDADALAAQLGDDVCCLYLQQPNYFGVIEDAAALGAAAHAAGAKFVLGVHPIVCAALRSPAEYGADIAVGEGQPLGMPLSFGGPYLGFMAAKDSLLRRLPGRIVGQTVDVDGKRAFVLTLQAREQHIRREKASSNICSNEALCALTAAVYMAAMGDQGMRQAAESCYAHAHYLADQLAAAGFPLRYDAPFFFEFVSECPLDSTKLLAALAERGILGGLPLPDGGLLWCATEMNDKAEIDALVAAVKEVAACS